MKRDLGILAITQESDHASFPMKNQGRGYTVINNYIIKCDFCTALPVMRC